MTRDLAEFLRYARAHGEVSDTKGWVSDLEDMLRVAWDLLPPEGQAAFAEHPTVLAIAEAGGETDLPG